MKEIILLIKIRRPFFFTWDLRRLPRAGGVSGNTLYNKRLVSPQKQKQKQKQKNKKTKGLIEKIMNKAHYWAHIYTYDGSKNGLRPETSIVGNLALTSMKHLRLRLGDCGINSSCGSSISDSDDGNTNIHNVKGSTSFGASRERSCCLFCVLCPCVTFAACGVLCLKRAECDSLIIKGGDGE